MKALITGADGQLGRALQALLPDAVATDHPELDITNRTAIERWDWSGVEAIINAAAFTQVDAAETDAQLLTAWDVNVTGVANLAVQARKLDIPLVHVSTDYVFAGDATAPIKEDAPLNPRSTYGIGKAASEFAARIAPQHHVVRSAWIFGDGANFVRTMLKLAETRDEVSVVDDQRGRPTYASDLARVIVGLLNQQAAAGTYHATNSGDIISWADFAAEIFQITGSNCQVKPISSADYLQMAPNSAPRPTFSALALGRLESVGIKPRDWHEALKDYLEASK